MRVWYCPNNMRRSIQGRTHQRLCLSYLCRRQISNASTPICLCWRSCSCKLRFSKRSIWWGGAGSAAAAIMLSGLAGLQWLFCAYTGYILVGKVSNNRATVVQRGKITCHTSSNSLMVAQHSHLSMRVILRPQKFVHHSCEYTQRCTMLVLTIVRPSAIESVTHGRLWISNMLKNQTRPQVSRKSHTTEVIARATLASHCANAKKQDRSVLKWSCANCERGFIYSRGP